MRIHHKNEVRQKVNDLENKADERGVVYSKDTEKQCSIAQGRFYVGAEGEGARAS